MPHQKENPGALGGADGGGLGEATGSNHSSSHDLTIKLEQHVRRIRGLALCLKAQAEKAPTERAPSRDFYRTLLAAGVAIEDVIEFFQWLGRQKYKPIEWSTISGLNRRYRYDRSR
jgi:hypothetical protein